MVVILPAAVAVISAIALRLAVENPDKVCSFLLSAAGSLLREGTRKAMVEEWRAADEYYADRPLTRICRAVQLFPAAMKVGLLVHLKLLRPNQFDAADIPAPPTSFANLHVHGRISALNYQLAEIEDGLKNLPEGSRVRREVLRYRRKKRAERDELRRAARQARDLGRRLD